MVISNTKIEEILDNLISEEPAEVSADKISNTEEYKVEINKIHTAARTLLIRTFPIERQEGLERIDAMTIRI